MKPKLIPIDDWETTLSLEVEATWCKGFRGTIERGGRQLEPDEPAGYEIGRIFMVLGNSRVDITDVLGADEILRINEYISLMDYD
jgi:hypothetical protein